MKNLLRKLFAPILEPLEFGEQAYHYRTYQRVIMLLVSTLFVGFACLVLLAMESLHYLIPVVVFGGAGLLGVIIALLGTDRAVAKIWGAK